MFIFFTKTRTKTVWTEKHIYSFIFITFTAAALIISSTLYLFYWLDIPDITNVLHYKPAQTSVIFDRRGKIVARIFTENRVVIPLSDMAKELPLAFVAAEDGHFFEHDGISLWAMTRAFINNLRSGGRGQGGSTITQQVVKSLLLSPEKSYLRKIRETILAWRIDKLLTKKEILTIYLNHIYLGEGAYGVESAAQIYFGKSASELNLGECSLLAGLPQAPSRYSLFDHQKRASFRQRYVLNRMAIDGYITAEEASRAYDLQVKLNSNPTQKTKANAYYLDEVKRRTRAIINQPLQQAGVKIYTYLDSDLQSKAQKVVQRGIKNLRSQKATQGALIAIEAKTGKVRALVGGTSFAKSQFNRATQALRPAGSTFKPFLFSAALNKGWQIESKIMDKPLSVEGAKGSVWSPRNYAGRYMGEVALKTALAHSLNSAAVRLMHETGREATMAIAKKAGITAKMPNDLSLALGAVDVSPLQLTGAYSIFADYGRFHRPRLIEKIVLPSGETLYPEPEKTAVVLSAKSAKGMRIMLNGVIRYGTGKAVRNVRNVRGGKTGTSDENRDAWFIGYSDNLITGVWVGNDHNQPMVRASGGQTAAPIWRAFMQ